MEDQDQREEYLRPAGDLLFLTTNKVKSLWEEYGQNNAIVYIFQK